MADRTCPTCHGRKKVTDYDDQEVRCDTCDGTGKVPDRGSLDNPKD